MIYPKLFAVSIAINKHQRIWAWGCSDPIFAFIVEYQVLVPYSPGLDMQIALLRSAKRKRKTAGLNWAARRGTVNPF